MPPCAGGARRRGAAPGFPRGRARRNTGGSTAHCGAGAGADGAELIIFLKEGNACSQLLQRLRLLLHRLEETKPDRFAAGGRSYREIDWIFISGYLHTNYFPACTVRGTGRVSALYDRGFCRANLRKRNPRRARCQRIQSPDVRSRCGGAGPERAPSSRAGLGQCAAICGQRNPRGAACTRRRHADDASTAAHAASRRK